MSTRMQAVLLNCGILAGLGIEYWKGSTLMVIFITWLLLFIVANLLLMFKVKSKRTRNV